jgi:23S rRNA (guanine2445-N2)-methyltransferase / 23S rRNA (guanine2069-N7)-methyltransferase
MCGTGTLLVEAAFMATDTAPGLFRGGLVRFGWYGHDGKAFTRLLAEARERARAGSAKPPLIVGYDRSEEARSYARESIARADVRFVKLENRALGDATPPAPGALVMVNPPYGDRLGEVTELVPLYEKLGDVLKQRFAGSTAYVITGSPVLATHLGLRPSRKWPLWNGPIQCRLLELPIEAAKGTDGPAWRKASPESAAFKSRLTKNVQTLTGWAKSEGIECLRLYDADVPEYNLAVDRYGDHVVVQEFAAPFSVDIAVAARRVRDALHVVTEVLAVPEENVVLKVRKRQTGGSQYERSDVETKRIIVKEAGLDFEIELGSHLDTGLFPDHRKLRALVAEQSRGKRMLNLFAYTCTASVHAAKAGAHTTSVDLSARYLAWGRESFVRNGLDPAKHVFLEEDCMRFALRSRETYDVVFSNPPTYSRSHRMDGDFTVIRDHVPHLRDVMQMLAPGGVIFFSTHAKGFELDVVSLHEARVTDITRKVLPRDYLRSPFKAYKIERRV